MSNIVTLYTMPEDEHCKHVKNLLQELAVEFDEVSVTNDENIIQELEEKTGQLSVPALVVASTDDQKNPSHVVVGFEPALIRTIFAK